MIFMLQKQEILKQFDNMIREALDRGDFGPTDIHQRSFQASYNRFLKEQLNQK